MAGRPPKVDGRKASEGARSIKLETLSWADSVEKPKRLCKWGRYAWDTAMKSLLPAQLISHGDLLAVEQMCRAWARWKTLEDKIATLNRKVELGGELTRTPNGHMQLSPLRISADRAMKQYLALAREFGLTPVSRVKTAGTAQGDLFDTGRLADEAPEVAFDPTDPYASLGRIQ